MVIKFNSLLFNNGRYFVLLLKGMTGALAPFSYLVFYSAGPTVRKLNLKLIGGERKRSFQHN
jgi:hypothetical protein